MKKILLFAFGIALILTSQAHAQHSHGYVGDFNDDGYLDFGDTETGNVLTDLGTRQMDPSIPTDRYYDEGFYYNGSWTPSALHGSDIGVGSDAYGALSGGYIYLVLYEVQGPTGATFGFYESGSQSVTLTMTTGMTGGTGQIALTEDSFFEADPSDPYGHYHGRRWVATAPGTYTVKFALVNTETGTMNSVDNEDHTDQQYFTLTWTVVPEPSTVLLLAVAAFVVLYGMRKRKTA
jgi:hypothetical protein